jgi:hypothetical protein
MEYKENFPYKPAFSLFPVKSYKNIMHKRPILIRKLFSGLTQYRRRGRRTLIPMTPVPRLSYFLLRSPHRLPNSGSENAEYFLKINLRQPAAGAFIHRPPELSFTGRRRSYSPAAGAFIHRPPALSFTGRRRSHSPAAGPLIHRAPAVL